MFNLITKYKYYSILIIGLLLFSMWMHANIVNIHTRDLQAQSIERIQLYKSSLNNELTRFNFLPFVIARDKQLIDWSFKQSKKANIALEGIKKESGANTLYVMNAYGDTLSSSNWKDKSSFINKNFSFRPYFKKAMKGGDGQFFGIGTTSKKPGFYISTGIKDQNKIIGVTVAKVDLSILENIWSDAGEKIFVTNKDGVVILSSMKQWKYHTIGSINELQLKDIKTQKQFSDKTLKPLSNNLKFEKDWLNINESSYLHQKEFINNTDWTIHYLTPNSQIKQMVAATWAKIGLIILILSIIALLSWLSRSHEKLKISIKESTELKRLNNLLKIEIDHRHKVESELLAVQKNIERTSRLTAMGQLSASIIHELGQPLSAMKAYIEGAQLPPRENTTLAKQEQTVLPKLDALVERMSNISQQLKFFSHNDKEDVMEIDIRDALQGVLIIISPALKQDNIELILKFKDQPYIVKGNQIRLEQVFVNIINNARDAVQKSTPKRITVQIDIKNKEEVIIRIIDTGTGISQETMQMLFDPFYTTKPSGVGLGLGLTISSNIVHTFGGTLTAVNNKDAGSTFTITMPLVL